MFTGSQPSAITLNNIMSPEALKGFMSAASPTEFDPALTPEAQDFKNLWIKEYRDWQEPNVSSFVNDYFALKAAVQQAGSLDSTKLAEVMSNGMKYRSLNGDTVMVDRPDLNNTPTIDPVSTFYFKQIVDGKPVKVGEAAPDVALQYIHQGAAAPPPGGPGGSPGLLPVDQGPDRVRRPTPPRRPPSLVTWSPRTGNRRRSSCERDRSLGEGAATHEEMRANA